MPVFRCSADGGTPEAFNFTRIAISFKLQTKSDESRNHVILHLGGVHWLLSGGFVITVYQSRFKEDLCIHPMRDWPILTLTADAEKTDGRFMILTILTAVAWKEEPAGIGASRQSVVKAVLESVDGPAFARMMPDEFSLNASILRSKAVFILRFDWVKPYSAARGMNSSLKVLDRFSTQKPETCWLQAS